ncbi:MAG: lysine--tRNA ligase [Bacilli bacterium]|nr:lysine--tRNA ligase [Bacilli bacterium]
MEVIKLNDQELVRRSKAKELRELGIDPYGARYDRKATSQDLKAKYSDFSKEELQEMHVITSVAGRIMSLRRKGKVAFMHIQDKFGQIQAYVRQDVLGEEPYEIFKKADIGDICGVEGEVIKTDTGELTVKATVYTHLSKALRPLPEKFHGLQDKEEARRHRYVDLIMNEESKKNAFLRPRIIRSIQRFFDERGFVEVETPVLQPILGGAAAKPFITHHNTLDKDFYLRIATELSLKKLIVGGMERVYEIGRLFRNEGMDSMHNPEFTTVEAYQAYSDIDGMMELAESLIKHVANDVLGKTTVNNHDIEINLGEPFKKIHMADAVKDATGIDFKKITDVNEALDLASKHEIKVQNHEKTVGHILNLFFEKYVEETLIQPTFVFGHPIEISPLAKKNRQDPRYTDRFELFIAGHEYANAFSELNDPIDQRERFEKQLAEKELGNDEANEMDTDFLEALEYGMAPTGGIGIGIDRLVMLLGEIESIRDAILFPQMKDVGKKKEVKKIVENTEEVIDFSNVEVEPLFESFVDFETFSKSDFRVVKVLDCVAVEKSKKLLKFTLNDGTDSPRVILSGIHAFYEPEQLLGKTLVAITNLPPRPMMGIESCGMLLSAVHHENGEEKLHLIMLDNHIPAGAKLY